jgi:hemoglobin
MRERSSMTHRNDFTGDLDRRDIQALAAALGLTIEELLQAPAAPAHHQEQQPPGSSLYQRIGYAGGLLWLVDTLYLRVLADPLLMSYFKHLDDQRRQGLRWHMLTLLAVVASGPNKYQGRDLHEAHADLHITEEAFDRLLWHLQETLQTLGFQREDEQAILAEVRARRAAIVTFEKSS